MEQQPFQHFVTRFSLSGDIDIAKTLIKTGEREMGILRKQLGHQDLMQGYRETAPFIGARINCSIVGTVRLIEIYVTPQYPLEPKEYEERPCFCNCCLAECQIVKIDGTWRDNDHYDIPLPDLGYQHGDRRLRYDVDVCSFLGISPESGLLTYEFYRVENVMPSDFTPYEVGDWAMVYFTDLVRETECGKCEDCDPPLNDELGRVWGCIPRDVAATLNAPQCIILPIAINDRISRSTVYFRPLESMRLGTCIKKAVIDWVQYSKLDDDGNPVDGYANIRWDAWPSIPGGTVVDNIPIRYCTQDFTNQDGSHAYRWGNSVYVLMEGENWTVIGRDIAELPTYQNQYTVAVPVINPALIVIMLWEQAMQDITDPEIPPDRRAGAWDFTHDTPLDFRRYAWSDMDYEFPLPPDSVDRLLYEFFRRGTGDQAGAGSYKYGYPSISFATVSAEHTSPSGLYDQSWGWCTSHTHELHLNFAEPVVNGTGVANLYGGVTSALYDGFWETKQSYYVHKTNTSAPYSVNWDIPADPDWITGDFKTHPMGPWAWTRMKHIDGYAWTSHTGFVLMLGSEHLVEMAFAYPWPGSTVDMVGFPSEYSRYWNGLVSKASCIESFDSTEPQPANPHTTLDITGTWEYLDIFSGRTATDRSVFSWNFSRDKYGSDGRTSGAAWYVGSGTIATGLPGLVYACSSSVMLKIIEARFDVVNLTMSQSSSSVARDGETRKHVRVELGGLRSRYVDPFTDGLGSTVFELHDKPTIVDDINGFAISMRMLNGPWRDNIIDSWNSGYSADITGTYLRTYETEDQLRARIL